MPYTHQGGCAPFKRGIHFSPERSRGTAVPRRRSPFFARNLYGSRLILDNRVSHFAAEHDADRPPGEFLTDIGKFIAARYCRHRAGSIKAPQTCRHPFAPRLSSVSTDVVTSLLTLLHLLSALWLCRATRPLQLVLQLPHCRRLNAHGTSSSCANDCYLDAAKRVDNCLRIASQRWRDWLFPGKNFSPMTIVISYRSRRKSVVWTSLQTADDAAENCSPMLLPRASFCPRAQ